MRPYGLSSVHCFRTLVRSSVAILAVAGMANAVHAQLLSYSMVRSAKYEQTSPNAVSGAVGYDASFQIYTLNPGEAVESTVLSPNGGLYTLSPTLADPTISSSALVSYNTLADFDQALPSGFYDYTINSGTLFNVVNTLSAPAVSAYPSAIPKLSAASYNALQNYSGTTPVTLNWNAFTVPVGYDGQILLSLVPQGGGAAINQTFAPDAQSYTINPGDLSSALPYTGYLTFFASAGTPGQDNGFDATLPTATVIYQNVTSFLITAGGPSTAAEPSVAGLALAPLVFMGAALLRRRTGQRKNKQS